MSDFGTYAFGVIGGLLTGITVTLLAVEFRDRSAFAIVMESRDYWKRMYEARCYDVDAANRDKHAAEQRAAVWEAQCVLIEAQADRRMA